MDVVDRPAPGVVLDSSRVVSAVGPLAARVDVGPEAASAAARAVGPEAAARAGVAGEEIAGAGEGIATGARAVAPPTGR